MRNIRIVIILTIVFASCNSDKKDKLEVSILNDTLIAFDYRLKKDTINLVKVEIKNNSNVTFYFNNIYNSDRLISNLKPQQLLSKNILNFKIFNSRNEIVNYDEINYRFDNKNDSIYRSLNRKILDIQLKRSNNRNKYRFFSSQDYNHFFIHPKEKLYFEFYCNLTDTLNYEYDRIRIARLIKNQDYFTKLFLMSDSTNYKNELPWDILQTIKANNAKVYHGIIGSKNKIPIKVLE